MNTTNFEMKSSDEWILSNPDSRLNTALDIGALTFLILDPLVILGPALIILARSTGLYDIVYSFLSIFSSAFGLIGVTVDQLRIDGDTSFNFFNYFFAITELIIDFLIMIKLSSEFPS
ncbi:unnamed protein product [Meganyctiphanes norvegica]|uniref:Uncharacterized protein n=1 Tax=Meganyctiphanes norvegica TaxID=48144 RepID=A0AAV2QI67_MEGNR